MFWLQYRFWIFIVYSYFKLLYLQLVMRESKFIYSMFQHSEDTSHSSEHTIRKNF
jgi:hypothetical protein